MNAAILIDFMKRLIQEAKKQKKGKVFLVLDNLRVHHAKLVQAWLQENQEHIEVFYLLSYSPESNPDEMLNANLKVAPDEQDAEPTQGAAQADGDWPLASFAEIS